MYKESLDSKLVYYARTEGVHGGSIDNVSQGLMSLKEAVTKFLRFLTGAGPDPPRDPYASVREPVRRGPGGRSAAVDVPEPEVDEQH